MTEVIDTARPRNDSATPTATALADSFVAQSQPEQPRKDAGPSLFERALQNYRQTWVIYNTDADNRDPQTDDMMSDALFAADERLMQTPAETISDLRAKIEILFDDPASIPNEERLANIFTDLQRLTGNEQSRTFDADDWLSFFERMGGGWVEQPEGDVTLLHPDTERARDHFWVLRTRGAEDTVKDVICRRILDREEPQPVWGKAVSAYQTAKAKLQEHMATPSPEFGDPKLDAYENKTEQLSDLHVDAVCRLIEIAPPDGSGFAYQMEVYASEKVAEWNQNTAYATILASRAKRFSEAA